MLLPTAYGSNRKAYEEAASRDGLRAAQWLTVGRWPGRIGSSIARSLIHVVSMLWWLFVITMLVWSYAHSLVKPPHPHT